MIHNRKKYCVLKDKIKFDTFVVNFMHDLDVFFIVGSFIAKHAGSDW